MTYFDKVEIFQCVSSKTGNIWHRIYAHAHFDKRSMQSASYCTLGTVILISILFKSSHVLLVTPGWVVD